MVDLWCASKRYGTKCRAEGKNGDLNCYEKSAEVCRDECYRKMVVTG